MTQSKSMGWLATLGLSLGLLEIPLLIFPIILAILTLGLSWGVLIPLALMLPVGLAGLIVSRIASRRLKEQDPAGQKRARLGIVFSTTGLVIGVLWLILLLLMMSSVFGQWY